MLYELFKPQQIFWDSGSIWRARAMYEVCPRLDIVKFQTIDLSGEAKQTRFITCKAGGRPSTRSPPGELVELSRVSCCASGFSCCAPELSCFAAGLSCCAPRLSSWSLLLCSWALLLCCWSLLLCSWALLLCFLAFLLCSRTLLLCVWGLMLCSCALLLCSRALPPWRWHTYASAENNCPWDALRCYKARLGCF